MAEIARLVGIGASAGGLESLEHLFSAIPPDTGNAYVVVQHLSPDFKSLMDELIARFATIPVVLASDGLAIEPNHIYLLPPRKEMIVRDGRLVLTEKPDGLSLPIDVFLRSLAGEAGVRGVAVVLSGSGSDGSRGLVDVKRAGGMVLAESPQSAKFDSMPVSAYATGCVDHVGRPGDLGRILCGLPPLEAPVEDKLSDDPDLDALFHLLRQHIGVDFSLYKLTTVSRRVQRRLDILRIADVSTYVEQLRDDTEELNALYQDLLIGVTQFFRDRKAFEVLETTVIPQLLDQVPPEQELRVWVAGCATGEEAYSLAMVFHEQMTARMRPLNVKILATDVHPSSLDTAALGTYGEVQLANVSPARLERFFMRRSTGFQVTQDLRQLVVFARHNLTKDAPFTKMHFISCRNMLIYLQPAAQRTVLSLFHFGLAANGMLFLGPSETPGSLVDEFLVVDDHWKIFRKRRDVHLLSQVRLPMPTPMRPIEAVRGDALLLGIYDQLLDRYMPPCLLVDEQRHLVDAFGGAEKLLAMRRRRPSVNITDLLEGGLRTVVAAAIQRVLDGNASVTYSSIPIGDDKTVAISADPYVHPRTRARHVAITFHGLDASAPPALDIPTTATGAISHERLDTLETELAYTRETLQATIEELETSNEEMQATNEELVASNEELQSTNEELHSVNEELFTVNAEYQVKIAELKELNADMQHLLEGTDCGTVFLDRELRIRRFTSRIASVFRLQPHDIGREIGDFSHNIDRDALMADIVRVRRDGIVIEEDVRDRGGTPYLLRILPYRAGMRDPWLAGPHAIDGVVLTLTDISALEAARARLAQVSALVDSSGDAIVGTGLSGSIETWNRGAELLYGWTEAEALGENLRILVAPETAAELAIVAEAIRRGDRVQHAQWPCVRKDGTPLHVSVTFSPIFGPELVGLSAIARDVTPLVAARRELEQRQERIRQLLESTAEAARRREQFLAMMSHELRNPLAAVLNASALLQSDPDPGVVARVQPVLERQTHHMSRLLDDLLDVSRITRGTFELRAGDVELREPIEAAVESTAPLFRTRGVELDVRIPDEAVPVKGDPARLQQVVVNLLSNAATYSPTSTRVSLTLTIDGPDAVIEVADRGIGIAPDMLAKIFELFVQADQRLDRPRGGLGVGLSLAKTIVELHGGSIAAASDGIGAGTTLVVRIPHDRGGARAEPAAERKPGRCRIVIVEDQPDAREMLRMLLESRDHVVLDAADGAAAVELIERERPDVALVDVGLPTMSGYEVAQRIRARRELSNVLLVALTGYGAPSDVTAARNAGFDEHVIKPARLDRIEEILATRTS